MKVIIFILKIKSLNSLKLENSKNIFLLLALGISSDKLDHLSWMQIQAKLLEAQRLNQMCIHKEELTELDVHNRILRYKNYMISMVHKQVLPLNFHLPFLGETTFLTEGLKMNIEWLLFGAHAYNPWSPFSSFQLKR